LVRPFDFQHGEILNVNKPEGMTSFQVVRMVRKWSGVRKVGHAGTLDPLATGVLLVCVGPATKKVGALMTLPKTYEGTIELGIRSDTDDAEGKITERRPVPEISQTQMEESIRDLTGEIQQIPPMFSAIKQNGKRLYQLARKGITVEREPRRVTVYEFELLCLRLPFLDIRICCSRGTYIRAIARDLGQALGTGGILKHLRRTRIGPYKVEESFSLDRLEDAIRLSYGTL
jgi:tRNA pseudouridine55 synthase